MRWVAKAKAELLESQSTNCSFDVGAMTSNYKTFDILAALRQLRFEAATETERSIWIEADRRFRAKHHYEAMRLKKRKGDEK